MPRRYASASLRSQSSPILTYKTTYAPVGSSIGPCDARISARRESIESC